MMELSECERLSGIYVSKLGFGQTFWLFVTPLLAVSKSESSPRSVKTDFLSLQKEELALSPAGDIFSKIVGKQMPQR